MGVWLVDLGSTQHISTHLRECLRELESASACGSRCLRRGAKRHGGRRGVCGLLTREALNTSSWSMEVGSRTERCLHDAAKFEGTLKRTLGAQASPYYLTRFEAISYLMKAQGIRATYLEGACNV